MTMILENILILLGITFLYFLLFAFIPFWLRGYRLSSENVMDNLIDSFLYGHLVIIMCVYTLSLAGIYYRFVLIILLAAVAVAYRFLFRRKETYALFRSAIVVFQNVKDGYYHPRVLFKNIFSEFVLLRKNTFSKIKNPVGFLFTVLIFAYGAYIRSYHSVVNMFYGSSDMYLHTEWIKFLMHNQPFISGVYPYGFHTVMASMSTVFGINVVTVIRMFGPITGMLAVFMIYYLLARTMRSAFAINVALAIYVVTDMFPFWATERQFLAVPQEFATIFLYPAAYFLYKYMKDKETRYLLAFSAAVALTILIHVFITLFAVLFCIAIFFSCIVYLNGKVFIRLVAAVLCSVFVALAPLIAGLMSGIELNGSAGWAVGVITGEEEQEDGAMVVEPADTIIGMEPAGTDEKIKVNSILEYPSKIYNKLRREGFFYRDYPLSLLNANWFYPYLISAALGILSPVVKFRGRKRTWIFAGLSIYSSMICVLYILAQLDIFSIMEFSRLYIYFIYSVPLVVAIPFEILHSLFYSTKMAVRAVYLSLVGIMGAAGIFYIGAYHRLMPLGRVWYSQYNGAVKAYYDIVDRFPKNQWIIVSSMSEYVQCLFDGYHYEMTDFIMDMHDMNANTKLYLPAGNVFIYVVKRPNTYLDTDIYQLGDFKKLPLFDKNDVYVDLEKEYGAKKGTGMLKIYRDFNANRVLQAKADAWVLEYMKYFPDEMSVFYEDNELIVYRIEQNPYALNNFAIPYEGNKKSAAANDKG